MNDAEIKQRIDSFPLWHYRFNLQGHETPVVDKQLQIRHRQRRRYFFDALVNLCGGSLEGKRVLDLGCNAGFWALHAVKAGCDYVLGIDGRQMHVDQANLVFEAKGVRRSRYDFAVGNVLEEDFGRLGEFDIVLCLGLMYHISKPMNLMENIAQVNTDLLVIDTAISKRPGSVFDVRREDTDDPRHAVDYEIVLVPSREAVRDLAGQFGYLVEVLKPEFQGYTGSPDYQKGRRRAFMCSKKTPLVGLNTEEI